MSVFRQLSQSAILLTMTVNTDYKIQRFNALRSPTQLCMIAHQFRLSTIQALYQALQIVHP